MHNVTVKREMNNNVEAVRFFLAAEARQFAFPANANIRKEKPVVSDIGI